MHLVLNHLHSPLEVQNSELLTALVAVLNDRTKLSALDPFPKWRNQAPVALDAAWPD